MLGWQADKERSDRYLPEIKQILGLHLIGAAPVEDDQERNTDLIVLKLDAVRIGCRVRNAERYLSKYGYEFTVRAGRPNGTKTELTKIIEGWGDYFFYGFGSEDGHLVRWMLGDLRLFRWWHSDCLRRNRGQVPGKHQRNGDGSSDFRAYEIASLPPQFVVASSHELRGAA